MNIEAIRLIQPGQTLWDKNEKKSVSGLHVRAQATGRKVFYLYYRTKTGRERRPKIGEFGPITLAEARDRAQGMLGRVSMGEDPKADWDTARTELTINDLFTRTWDGYWSQPRFERSGWGKEAKRIFDKTLSPAFGRLPLSEVTPGRIRAWHERFKDKPYAGNRALEVLSRMFKYAEELELRAQHTNPCSIVKAHPETKRSRFASKDELAKIGPILEREAKDYPAAAAFLYLLILTGSRPRAIERATWEQLNELEVNGQPFGVLTFHGKTTEKTGQEEKVIVPPQAMKIIKQLPRLPGRTITGLKMPRKLWSKIKTEAGCPDLWARDWRRTFATVGKSDGIEIGIIGELLNHRTAETTKIYAKVMNEEAVTAVGTIANKMAELMAPKVSS